MIIAHFEVSANIDILTVPRITLGPGKHAITDARVIRVLRNYPACRLISLQSENPAPCAGGTLGTGAVVRSEVQIKTYSGPQVKEKRPILGRVVDDRE